MTPALDRLNRTCRPRLLIQAARIGAATYRRNPHLRRLLDVNRAPSSAVALSMLMDLEDLMNAQRQANDASYSAADHVDLLIAMMGEARLLRATTYESPAPTTPSVTSLSL